MPNLPYMPDSHLIDAISVRASGHHHRGLCVPMTRPLTRPSIPATRLPCTDALIQVRLQFSCACARVLVVRGAFCRCSCAFPLCRPRFISCCCVVRWRFMLSWRVCAVVLCCRVFLLPSCGAVVWFRAVVWCCRLVWFLRAVVSFRAVVFVPWFRVVLSCVSVPVV